MKSNIKLMILDDRHKIGSIIQFDDASVSGNPSFYLGKIDAISSFDSSLMTKEKMINLYLSKSNLIDAACSQNIMRVSDKIEGMTKERKENLESFLFDNFGKKMTLYLSI